MNGISTKTRKAILMRLIRLLCLRRTKHERNSQTLPGLEVRTVLCASMSAKIINQWHSTEKFQAKNPLSDSKKPSILFVCEQFSYFHNFVPFTRALYYLFITLVSENILKTAQIVEHIDYCTLLYLHLSYNLEYFFKFCMLPIISFTQSKYMRNSAPIEGISREAEVRIG